MKTSRKSMLHHPANPARIIRTLYGCGILAFLIAQSAFYVSAQAATPLLSGSSSTFEGLAPNYSSSSSADSPALNGAGWYFYNLGGGHAWQIDSVTSSSPLNGNVLRNKGGSAQATLAATQWESVSLTNIGDSISVTFDLQTKNGAAADDRPFSISLINSPAKVNANIFGNDAKTHFSGASGYAFTQVLNTANGNYSTVSNDSSAILKWTSTDTGLSELPVTNNGVVHSYVFTITRVASGIEVSIKVDNVPYTSYIDTSMGTSSFNTLILQANADNAVATMFDNIKVEYSAIPESKALSLVVGSVVLMSAVFLANRNSGKKTLLHSTLATDSE